MKLATASPRLEKRGKLANSFFFLMQAACLRGVSGKTEFANRGKLANSVAVTLSKLGKASRLSGTLSQTPSSQRLSGRFAQGAVLGLTSRALPRTTGPQRDRSLPKPHAAWHRPAHLLRPPARSAGRDPSCA